MTTEALGVSNTVDDAAALMLEAKRIAFIGKLGGLTKREAQTLVRRHGGVPVDRHDGRLDLVVIGAEELPLDDQELLDDVVREAAAAGQLEIINETELWQRLGLVEYEHQVQQLYTPAMLADLLQVPVSIVRRWHRRGLIVPVREVHRLPYFDFQEVSTARQLARLLAAGASPSLIEAKLEELARFVPDVDRPLAQLSVIVEGRQLLLRQGEGLIEPGGQRRFDFDASVFNEGDESAQQAATTAASLPAQDALEHAACLRLERHDADTVEERDRAELINLAAELEDEGEFASAVEVYRTLLLMHGPDADVSFQLAELLYRLGDRNAALERYYMAVEIDEDYVEARANLGCVLEELGHYELAIAAFYGALERHPDYPDVHYHLAGILEECGRFDEARNHWCGFLALAPDSPWASEARERLGLGV
jgi:tetratricopeptide (TPR) repeat protein